ncbi:kinesin light chain, partial [Macroventuria anomochaeta]
MVQQLRREDYTVGWVCALPVELAAAQEMLDEEHDTPRCDAHDTNLYTCGRVGEHNIVIACLPEGQTGTNSAAAVAVQMKSTFSSTRFGLMVGIGGGVPSEEADVRLGDVVVSKPHKVHGGVVQYDSGKATPSGFERTGFLNTPPTVLLNAVANLRAKHMRGRGRLLEYLSKLDSLPDFSREAAGPDTLFKVEYDHAGSTTCEKCSKEHAVAREARRQEVVVHHGTIASGNQVMRSATERDRVSAELGGVLCFEMEAAGLMNSFPCLVIRGVCDYADSHKNKRWQPYAAGTAAAYAKEVLSVIPPADVVKSRTAEETMRDATKPTYCIPFLKNLHFVGRRDELAVLRQRLLIDQDCQKMSIVGLGGTGKTQVALQFVYTVKETQPEWSIFWVPALSMESFEQACVGIAVALSIPQAADGKEDAKELVKQWLSSSQAGRWLLLVDNADDPEILFGSEQSKGIVDYLPDSESGVVVYTTRILEVAVSLTRSDVLELGAMDRQDAAVFFSKSLIRKDLLRDDAMTHKLLDELTCLPLAIAQAAAYLNMNRTTIIKYMRLLRNTEQDLVGLMSEEFRDDTRYKGSANAVATTWVVSFRQIRERDTVAANLLAFMSCVEWKAIPRSLLPSTQSEGRMEKAIGMLCGYSFLMRRGDDKAEEWYDIHRLVHLATRLWVREQSDPAGVMEEAVRHVAKVFPSDDYANRQVWRAYLPHALRLLKAEQGCDVKEKPGLCLWVGRCLEVDGRIQESVMWLEESYRLRSMLEEDDPDLLFTQHELAIAYRADGQVQKAIELLERVVEVEEKTLLPEHPDRLASQHALAMAYRADGQVQKAVELLEAVVEVEEKTLVPEHPSRLASQHVLAGAYREDGQVQKAVALLEAVVNVQEKTLLPEHPSRLASQHSLAMAYHADGQVQKAVELLEAVVEVRERTLLPGHPDRLASQHALAMAY